MNAPNPCVVCHFPFPQGVIVHQETHVQYPFCRACANKGYFNPGIFQYTETEEAIRE